jgi:hypothetical protein
MQTKIFELTFGWQQEAESYLFSHENKTEEEFNLDINSLLKKYAEDYFQSEWKDVNISNWIRHIIKYIPELGYVPVKPIIKSFFKDYKEYEEDFYNAIGHELHDKMELINKQRRIIN